MESGPELQKPGWQPRLWLVGIALVLGVGIGAVIARASDDPRNPLFQSPWLFGVSAVAQAWFGRALIRAGEQPRHSLLAESLRQRLRGTGTAAELKPLLWSTAFVMLMLAGMTLTMFVVLTLAGP